MSKTANKKQYTVMIAVCAILCFAVIAAAIYFATSGTPRNEGSSATDTEAVTAPTEPAAPSEPVENRVEQNDNIADDIFND